MSTTEKSKKPLIKPERKPRAKKDSAKPHGQAHLDTVVVPDNHEPKPAPKRTKRQTAEMVDNFAKQMIDAVRESVAKPKQVRAKRVLSDEQKQVLRERLVKAREAKVAKKGGAGVPPQPPSP